MPNRLSPGFHSDKHIARRLGKVLSYDITCVQRNTGLIELPERRFGTYVVKVGWIFSPEDIDTVEDANLVVVFMSPTEKSVKSEIPHVFYPDPDEVTSGTGWWSDIFMQYAFAPMDTELICVDPCILK